MEMAESSPKRLKMDSECCGQEDGGETIRNDSSEAVIQDSLFKKAEQSFSETTCSHLTPDHEALNVMKENSNSNSELAKPEPIPGRCHFYLVKKKRFCKAVPWKDGKEYCVEHSPLTGDDAMRKRIQCPLDPKHTCFEHQLKKHLKKCNARPELKPVCYNEGINSGDLCGADPSEIKVTIREVADETVLQLAQKVKALHKEHVPILKNQVLFHDVLKEEADKPTNGVAAHKHIQQQASLIGHMEHAGLLTTACNYVEFGAGKGGLSHWVQLAMKDFTDNKYLLVDKGSVRYKMDTYHKGEDQGPSFERLKINIEDLDLGLVPTLQASQRPVVGMGKHLCGGATDFMLRCLMETGIKSDQQNSETKKSGFVMGLVLALCCHHRCDWKSYVGKQFMTETCGLTPQEFSLVSSMSSWATCGTQHVTQPQKDDDTDLSNRTEEGHSAQYNHKRYGSLIPQEREEIGRYCKQLIDMGRVMYLRQHHCDADLINYVDRERTLENMAIIAKPQS